MSAIDLSVTGMEELNQFFDRPQSVAEHRAVGAALQAGGELVMEAARQKIHSVSGDLAGSLEVTTAVGKYKTVATVHHGTGGAHDHLVEYGHAASGWNKSKQPVLPHPYMWPAYEEQKKAAYEKIKAGVAEAVRKS
jgi:hypothetical protein